MAVKSLLTRAALAVERPIDRCRFRLKRRLGLIGPITIIPYRGYGNGRETVLRGRVLEDRMLSKPRKEDSIWTNLRSMIRRFTSEEIPGARVRAAFRGREAEVVSDDEGFFEVRFTNHVRFTNQGRFVNGSPGAEAWQPVHLELVDSVVPLKKPVSVTGQVMVPSPGSRFGVISDMDDTILISHATTILSNLEVLFLNNAFTRKPFEGVAAFYRALQKGPDRRAYNPIFYVSSSPWNIYDLFDDFCRVNGIPAGPFFLQNYGLERDQAIPGNHRRHKMRFIREIMETYPDLPFILIGDSGQKDPEIYNLTVRDMPRRVLAVYIRDVSPEIRHREVLKLARGLEAEGVEMLLVRDTLEAARHAVERGYIHPDSLPSIGFERAVDRSAPHPLRQFVGEKVKAR